MKILEFKSNKKRNTKITIGIIIAVSLFILLFSLYITNQNTRAFINRYIFRKEIVQDNISYIKIEQDDNSSIYAYDKYITVLNKNQLFSYTSSGNVASQLDISINKPVYSKNNRFLCMGEEKGKKVYLISGNNILWQKDIEGEITKLNVNKNGYVSVVLSGTTYKSVIVIFSPEGKELFSTYLSSTIAIDTDISNDNKYLAVAEMNTSGTIIESSIKIISMEKAESDASNSIVYTYTANNNELLTNIKYQDKATLVCLYDDGIHLIQKEQDSNFIDINEKATHCDIDLKNNVVQVVEKNSGLFSTDIEVLITNVFNKTENLYKLSNSAKGVYVYNDVIAINIGSEVHFISTNGWLLKKYLSSQEVSDIVLGDSIGGIIYKDKIEIVEL